MSLEEKSLVLRVTKQNGQNVTISLPTNVLRKKLDLKSLILDGEMLASSFKC
jgi:ATP-dependent DNA ligase